MAKFLMNLYQKNQITYEEFAKHSETKIHRIIDKSKDLEISKEYSFHVDL